MQEKQPTDSKNVRPKERKDEESPLTSEGTDSSCTWLHLFVIYKANKPTRSHLWAGPRSILATAAVSPVWRRRVKSHPRHASTAQFKWKLDELLGSDPAISSN